MRKAAIECNTAQDRLRRNNVSFSTVSPKRQTVWLCQLAHPDHIPKTPVARNRHIEPVILTLNTADHLPTRACCSTHYSTPHSPHPLSFNSIHTTAQPLRHSLPLRNRSVPTPAFLSPDAAQSILNSLRLPPRATFCPHCNLRVPPQCLLRAPLTATLTADWNTSHPLGHFLI